MNEKDKLWAIEMILAGEDLNHIANSIGMSRSSVVQLKYQYVKRNDERVECQICHGMFKQITGKHLLRHSTTFDEYCLRFPNVATSTQATTTAHKSFKNKNKGKTFEEIYGDEESVIKKRKISLKQIGRRAPTLTGTGFAGTRKDTGTYARSTYEANIDRIFQFHNKKYADEFSEMNPRVNLVDGDKKSTYQPDRVDIDGLFDRDARIEVKGYMRPEGWKRICLFREQYPDHKLIVISSDKLYANISYADLQKKYASLIPLWETPYQNIKTRPDLYEIGYVPSEIQKEMDEKYPFGINRDITDEHKMLIAKKCLSYCAVSLGKNPFIDRLTLVAISDHREKASKKSSGEFNFEMWKIETVSRDQSERLVFWVSNLSKTTEFTCHGEIWRTSFFDNNCDMSLIPGRKSIKAHPLIDEELWLSSSDHQRQMLQLANNKLQHQGVMHIVTSIELLEQQATKRGAHGQYERWKLTADGKFQYILDNFGKSTQEYVLIPILDSET